jgi:hypothetical protein
MSDYLGKLAARHRHELPLVAPRLPSMFESVEAGVSVGSTGEVDDLDGIREETIEVTAPRPSVERLSAKPVQRVEPPQTVDIMPKRALNVPIEPTAPRPVETEREPSFSRRKTRAEMIQPRETITRETSDESSDDDTQHVPSKPRRRARSVEAQDDENFVVPERTPQVNPKRHTSRTPIVDETVVPATVPPRPMAVPSVETPKTLQVNPPTERHRSQPIEPHVTVRVQTRIERQEQDIKSESGKGAIIPAQPSEPLEHYRLPSTGHEKSSRPVEPTVHVTIGRIEVRAVTPAQEEKPKSQRKPQTIGLDEYLRRRDRKGQT